MLKFVIKQSVILLVAMVIVGTFMISCGSSTPVNPNVQALNVFEEYGENHSTFDLYRIKNKRTGNCWILVISRVGRSTAITQADKAVCEQ